MTQHYTTSQMLMMDLRSLNTANELGLRHLVDEDIKNINREMSILNFYTWS